MASLVIIFITFGLFFYSCDGKPQGFPRLYFSTTDLPRLIAQSTTTHSFLFKQFQCAAMTMLNPTFSSQPPKSYEKFAAHWNEIYGNNLPPIAFYSLLNASDAEARRYTINYMDIMHSYRSWYVTLSPKDEVPVSHSLTGFATAFDFMYQYLDKNRREKYMSKIIEETGILYDTSLKRWWGNAYLQNHVFTNFVAMLTGALICNGYDKRCPIWLRHARKILEENMEILEHVPDGSLDEGVAYGSYTSRSLTQFVFLSMRHFKKDYSHHPWLLRHFDFLYYTVLPGFRTTVGIGDSNINWFYGPESQLVFLDSFVLKSGKANWLAQNIRKHRLGGINKLVTSHTEYLWFNSSIKPRPPKYWNVSHMHVFQDWGLATLRLGSITDAKASFFSLKSGAVGGKAVQDMITSGKFTVKNFNAGHEHPDQNSVTVSIRGTPVITEDLYNYKFTNSNNVLMFQHESGASCTPGWFGQMGDCVQWYLGLQNESFLPSGHLKTLTLPNSTVMIGESVGAYPTKLRLKNVRRYMTVSKREHVIIIDHIIKAADSKVKKISSFFNNNRKKFKPSYDKLRHRYGVTINKTCRISWLDYSKQSPKGYVLSIGKTKKLHNLNVTWTLAKGRPKTSIIMVYVIHCDNQSREDISISMTNKEICVKAIIGSLRYSISIPKFLNNELKDEVKVLQDNVDIFNYRSPHGPNSSTPVIPENPVPDEVFKNSAIQTDTLTIETEQDGWLNVCKLKRLVKYLLVGVLLLVLLKRCKRTGLPCRFL